MTKKSVRARRQQTGVLKVALFTGSLVATMAGTYLLGLQEPSGPAALIPDNETAAFIVSEDGNNGLQLLPANREGQVQLRLIPQVVQPRFSPVARTRSSR
ncbi:MAG: hypothetical protein ACK2T3_16910 [Candidatus Promineifilaceae bacterium]